MEAHTVPNDADSRARFKRPIQILPQDVTSRIAAGEVVERPASVLKELAENALDAHARRIDVEIAEGGKTLVRVSDDGWGMGRQDLSLCTLPHATSKLTAADELSELTTLGFRGEALPSIAAVSQFSITSRARASSVGSVGSAGNADASLQGGTHGAGDAGAWRIEVSGGHPHRPELRPAAGAYGTVVEARDLFFNLPARAKFLKGSAAEAAACTDCLLRLAISRPDVSFSLRAGSSEIFSASAVNAFENPAFENPQVENALAGCGPSAAPRLPLNAFLQRAREVLGRASSRGLLTVAAESGASENGGAAPDGAGGRSGGYRLYGLVSPPALSRPNRAQIYLNVNGRPVKDRTLSSALLESYRHLLPPKRFPVAVLYLDLPGGDVDINVHPTKAEVRFRLPGLVYALFHDAIRRACGATRPLGMQAAPELHAMREPPLGAPRPLHGQNTFAYDSACVSGEFSRPLPGTPASRPATPFPNSGPNSTPNSAPSSAPAPADISPKHSAFIAREMAQSGRVNEDPPALSPVRSQAQFAPFRVLGQAGGSYIVLEDDTGLKIVDQHALHERVLFDALLARAQGRCRGDAQGLLIPETLELTPVQAAVFSQDPSARALLENLGFEVEAFGVRALAVRAVPAILKAASASLVRDVLDALALDEPGGSGKKPGRMQYRERAAYVLACKGALKAGERLSHAQMTALVQEFRAHAPAGAFTCPHGRPLAKEISWEELEHAVGRR